MKWLDHVKKTMKSMKGEKKAMGKKWFSHVLKTAKKTYHKKGGADPAPEKSDSVPDIAGGRRRHGGKTRRSHRK